MKYFDLKTGIIVLLLIGIIVGGTILNNHNKRLANELRTEINLKNALNDSINHYQNKEGEWVAEKLTLQADIKTLEDNKINLTENQQKLLSMVSKLQKDKDVINAALVQQSATIDSLVQYATNIDTVNNSIGFVMDSDTLKYDIKIQNVKPLKSLEPKLLIASLNIPNEQFIEFHWEDSKTTPIAFSVTNSNPLFKTNDIDSYAIPELDVEITKSNIWTKFKKSKMSKPIIFGLGAALGVFIAK